MEAQTGTLKLKLIIAKIVSYSLITFSVIPSFGQESARKSIDPAGRFARLMGEVTQLDTPNFGGNGFFVDKQGCYIATNYHVAFGKGEDPVSGKTIMVKDADVGHKVNFAYDLDSKTGKFKRSVKATVVKFGNYQAGNARGILGDMAVLKLEQCAGADFAGPKRDRPEPSEVVSSGELMTVSTTRTDSGKNEVYAQQGCYSEKIVAIPGTLVTQCEAIPTMSGSMVLKLDQNQEMTLVGLTTKYGEYKDGTKVLIAIHSRVLSKFIDSALGEDQPVLAPLANERAPQSENLASVSAPKPRTTVR